MHGMKNLPRHLCTLFLLLAAVLPGAPQTAAAPAQDTLPDSALLPAWVELAQQPPPSSAVLEPELLRALAQATPDETLRVIVVLREQAAPEEAVRGAASRVAARNQLVAALRAVAERSQAALRACLDAAQAAGSVDSYTPLWIWNGLAVRARPAVIRELAARPEVASIAIDHYQQWITTDSRFEIQADSRFEIQNELLEPRISNLEFTEWGVARIHAPEVWASLHVSGTGAVVAGMDTGVDWLHPALQASYRGYNPHGVHLHAGNWFDAVNGALYPMDDHGHGTHTMGTMVGQGGIGVAPGAQWIAVKVLSGEGYGYDSWIHAGFQWLLAPGDDPARAPDVVNCSWGSANGTRTVFQPDIRALRAAGIVPVFSNGNDGPDPATVGSPASLPESLAVGATDEYDEVAYFSSRGPSPWGEIRPHVAAPGVHVRSSLPGGLYGSSNGTSMAAPHVSGIVALLRSVSPTIGVSATIALFTRTATPLGNPIPNNDSGWGIVDAFAAVSALAHPGLIAGTVRRADDDTPIAGATVRAVQHVTGDSSGQATSDAAGDYLLALAPAFYDLTASAFGYAAASQAGVQAVTDTTTVVDFALVPLPSGVLHIEVASAAGGEPLSATVAVLDTPFETVASSADFALPGGSYTLRARLLGYRVVTATATVDVGQVTTVTLALLAAPSILLLDSGGWYYESQASYYRQSLDELAYVYDEWPIRHLPDDVPPANALLPYDVVVWSAPMDSPGMIGADQVLASYLSAGGLLFISGQDIGYADDSGLVYAPYYREYLKARLVNDSANLWTLRGVDGELFAGMAITITGAGGADNQLFPDVIDVVDPHSAAPVWNYAGGGAGGLRVSTCQDYRVVYLSFGFEAIADPAARREVLARSLDWLTIPPPTAGLEMTPPAQTRVGLAGTTVTHTLSLRHVGQAGSADVISLTLQGADWPTELPVTALPISPCATVDLVISVTIPSSAGWDERDPLTLTARSTLSPALALTATLLTKTPAPVLLLDDDRFYEQSAHYEAAMAATGLSYDLWQTCPATGSCRDGTLPPLGLSPYPIVVWWTGYDWYRPLTNDEIAVLTTYLDGGGRLFLSSQDYLYYHSTSPFSSDYLGVLTYRGEMTPTLATGVPENAIADGMGPYALIYPYRNWADEVEPTPGTDVVLRDQRRGGIALARRQNDHAAVFFPFPFETLPEGARPAVMASAVGWLSWLGSSTWSASSAAISPGGTLTYTLHLHNDGPTTVTASLSNTLPPSLALVPGSLSCPAAYSPSTRTVTWSGPLAADAVLTVTYAATISAGLPAGTALANEVHLGLEEQRIDLQRRATVRVAGADLAPTTLQVDPAAGRPGAAVTATLALVNAGPENALTATAVISLPAAVDLALDSLAWQGGGNATATTQTVRWSGPLSAQAAVTVSCRLTLPVELGDRPFYVVAFLQDGAGGAWERPAWLWIAPWKMYLPVVER